MNADARDQDSHTTTTSGSSRPRELGGKYLTFRLGHEQFGLEILKVREIMGFIHITPVPKSPPAVRGVLNLRGKIVPVIDLRCKFQMDVIPTTDRTCIIVVDMQVYGQSSDVGILVDNVSEVLNIRSEDIGPPPTLGCDMDANYIRGMAKSSGSVTILLEIENVLSENDLGHATAAANDAETLLVA